MNSSKKSSSAAHPPGGERVAEDKFETGADEAAFAPRLFRIIRHLSAAFLPCFLAVALMPFMWYLLWRHLKTRHGGEHERTVGGLGLNTMDCVALRSHNREWTCAKLPEGWVTIYPSGMYGSGKGSGPRPSVFDARGRLMFAISCTPQERGASGDRLAGELVKWYARSWKVEQAPVEVIEGSQRTMTEVRLPPKYSQPKFVIHNLAGDALAQRAYEVSYFQSNRWLFLPACLRDS